MYVFKLHLASALYLRSILSCLCVAGYSSVHMSHSEEGADRFTKMRLFNEVYF